MTASPSTHDAAPPATLALQGTLPHLPVPSLDKTFAVYLRSLEPLVSPEQLATTKANVADFLRQGGLGEQLQRRLIDHAARETVNHGNWLDAWWLRLAYHQWREPLLVNSNWCMLFHDDPALVKAVAAGQCDISGRDHPSGYSAAQVKRAVSLLQGWLDIKDALEQGRYPIERMRDAPLCMHQYYQFFGVTRVPMPGCDMLRGGGTNYSQSKAARDVLLMMHNQPYRVPVYTEDGQRLSDADLESQFWRAIHDLEARMSSSSLDEPVCLFTGDHRDLWAEARQKLVDLSDVNVRSLEAIEACIMAVSLDEFAARDAAPPSASANDDVAIACSYRNGLANPNNRWFDKCLTEVVERDGRASVNGEHSPCDALIASIMGEATVRRPLTYMGAAPPTPSAAGVQAPQALRFVLDATLADMLKETRRRVDAVSANSDSNVLRFRDYGADTIKRIGKVSPDAYVQMALQLAYYTMHRKFAPTYESASTRIYLKGRTETVRTLSSESRAWCEAMHNPAISNAERYRLFQAACKAHVQYLKIASNGYGCDRHLLGLRMMLRDGEQHAVFTDRAFGESQTWRLSTSALTTGDLILACGFGAVVEDGYGINYQARPNILQFGMESKVSCQETDTKQFRATLEQVLRDMRTLCEAVNGADNPRSSKM
ncbi:carnitine acetyltransferase [Syncephalis pseudoplumigaleata]|uniref:Carnitine acetyltransferase n=1 Tax=Syncephalis pseudoplumigaleata TaxID=1712513 RepID=A0A4V1J2D6_9FUNG|nr:carnitine acetyltransferase [Syncephalis pseudoplumigaleata]|eukprot:RKP28189.1 carnitine acetyltransferase [Syncephalis pseudoplumigaleata]